MNLVGFTVVWGDNAWVRRAERVLALWSYNHRRAKTVILRGSDYDSPAYAKTRILDHVSEGDVAVYMDADTVCTGSTEPDLYDGDLGLVEDGDMYTVRRCEPRMLWFNRPYYNAGYIMVRKTPDMVRLMDAWWALRASVTGALGNQSAMNHIIGVHHAPVTLLPPSCNWFVRKGEPPGGTNIVHWAGLRDFADEQNILLLKEERRTGLPVKAV